jgi:hypothetical protein
MIGDGWEILQQCSFFQVGWCDPPSGFQSRANHLPGGTFCIGLICAQKF